MSEFESLVGSGFRARVNGKILEISKLSDKENMIDKELLIKFLLVEKLQLQLFMMINL